MTVLKVGQRLKSTVCDAEIMLIVAPEGDVVLACGGTPMGENGAATGSVDPDHADGVVIGKRYMDEDGSIEVLCIKPGDGSLSLDGAPLRIKDAKKVPKTD